MRARTVLRALDSCYEIIRAKDLRLIAMGGQLARTPYARVRVSHELPVSFSGAIRLIAEHAKGKSCGDPVTLRQPEVDTVARPDVIARIANQSAAHGIEMNISNECGQVAICVDQHRVVAPLKKMAGSIQTRLYGAGVLARDSQHELA